MRKSALDPLLPRVTQGLLAATCTAPDRAWYLSDLAKTLHRTPSSLQEPLAHLVEAGILKRWKDGNRVYFQADADCPFLAEIRGLIAKTAGLADVVRNALAPHRGRIQLAFVYGSIARGQERSTSDVDLLIIGEIGLRRLSPALDRAEQELRRPVNATIYSLADFASRLQERNHFLLAVLDSEKIFVLGTPHDLAAITERRTGRAAPDDKTRVGRTSRRRRQKSG